MVGGVWWSGPVDFYFVSYWAVCSLFDPALVGWVVLCGDDVVDCCVGCFWVYFALVVCDVFGLGDGFFDLLGEFWY